MLHRFEQDEFWALPGGRVEPGEDAASTVVREMQEELHQAVACGPLLFVVENFFAYREKPNHEIGFYFRVVLPGDSPLLDASRSHLGREGDRALEFRWFPLAGLGDVNLHPSFLRSALARPMPGVGHIVQRDVRSDMPT